MKKILVLNSGSTTVKYQLFNMDGESHQVVAKGMAERIGISGSRVSMSVDENEKLVKDIELHNHIEAIKEVLNMLLAGPIKSVEEIDAVGHRMGHGGEYFDKSVVIDEDVLAKAREAGDLLPLCTAPRFCTELTPLPSCCRKSNRWRLLILPFIRV